MFYLTLVKYRVKRMHKKYRDMRETSGSTLQACIFLLSFVYQRFGYLYSHARSRGAISAVRAEIVRENRRPCAILAVKVIGGLGDHIIAARMIRDLAASCEFFMFDLYSSDPKAAAWVFASAPGFRKAYSEFLFDTLRREYDLALWVSHFVAAYAEDADWPKLRQSSRLHAAVQAAIKFRPEIDEFVVSHPARDNALARKAVAMKHSRMSLGQGMLRIPKGVDMFDLAVDERILASRRLEPWSYVTIHNGFDPNMVVVGDTSTKCYPRFAEVVSEIKAARPDLTIVQVGASTSAPIEGVDLSLVGMTNLPELGALLKHAAWHVDIESGLVHMARCFDTGCTVIFGPTPADYFGYETNQNLSPPQCGDCWWTRETWMARCPRGWETPICTTHDPVFVARQVLQSLNARRWTGSLRSIA